MRPKFGMPQMIITPITKPNIALTIPFLVRMYIMILGVMQKGKTPLLHTDEKLFFYSMLITCYGGIKQYSLLLPLFVYAVGKDTKVL